MKPVQRFVARVKPHRTHPEYYEWQTGIVCLLVGESDKSKAQSFAEAEIRRRGWERIEFTDRSTLIEKRVIEQGGEFLDAYLNAQAGTPFFLEELDEIAFARKSSRPSIVAPRLTEAFIDRVVQGAGGHRIDTDQKRPDAPKTADYRVGPWILELKDLQTESLEIRTRQAKLAKLFASKLRPDRSVIIDPDLLTDDEQREYLNVVGEPIRQRLKDAGRQVRATLDRLSAEKVRGGAIIMNTGYGSVSPAVLLRWRRSMRRSRQQSPR